MSGVRGYWGVAPSASRAADAFTGRLQGMTRQRPARWQKSVEEEVSPQVHEALKAEPQKEK